MLGRSAMVGTTDSPTKGRVFVYEVAGLRQNTDNDSNNYQFRSSGNVLIKVPYGRMNEEMQRINRMGGKIVSITAEGAPQKAKADE